MALCRIVSRSLRAAIAATVEQPLILHGARHRFWRSREQKRVENNLINLLNTKITAFEELKQDLVIPPPAFPFNIEHVPNGVKLDRRFDKEESIGVLAKRCKDADGEPYLKISVAIGRPFGRYDISSDLVLKVELNAYPNHFDITRLNINNTYRDESPDAGKMDEDMKKCLLKYLQVRGFNKNNVEYLLNYIPEQSRIESWDNHLHLMNKLKKFVENDFS